MIQKVQILDANYSGLEAKFPQGLELDTDSPIVLLVGPNNVGKTAFLRMLATSISFERYFRGQGISHFWDYSADGIEQSASQVVNGVKEAKEVENGLFYFNEAQYQRAFRKLCERRGIPYSDQVRTVENKKVKYPGYSLVFDAISPEGKSRILRMEDILKEGTDENIWGFVKPTRMNGGEIFFQHFDLPYDDMTAREQSVGLREYVSFMNKDDYSFGKLKTSPGHNLYGKLEQLFDDQIRRFFEQQETPRWEREDYSPRGRVKKMMSFDKEKPLDKVPSNARLCVIMDEPTIFLDAVNKFRFQKKMEEVRQQYPGRIQFFIATNDYAVIQGLRGICAYINLYEQPAVSSRTFNIQKYLISAEN